MGAIICANYLARCTLPPGVTGCVALSGALKVPAGRGERCNLWRSDRHAHGCWNVPTPIGMRLTGPLRGAGRCVYVAPVRVGVPATLSPSTAAGCDSPLRAGAGSAPRRAGRALRRIGRVYVQGATRSAPCTPPWGPFNV